MKYGWRLLRDECLWSDDLSQSPSLLMLIMVLFQQVAGFFLFLYKVLLKRCFFFLSSFFFNCTVCMRSWCLVSGTSEKLAVCILFTVCDCLEHWFGEVFPLSHGYLLYMPLFPYLLHKFIKCQVDDIIFVCDLGSAFLFHIIVWFLFAIQ
jgi:hypothetical protein